MNKSAALICSVVVLASLVAVCLSQITTNPQVNSQVQNLVNTGEGAINTGTSQANGGSNAQSNGQTGASVGGPNNNASEPTAPTGPSGPTGPSPPGGILGPIKELLLGPSPD